MLRRVGTVLMLMAFFLLVGTSAPAFAESDGRCSMWIDLYRGEPIGYAEMLQDLADVRVVYLGERHTLERHHQIQAKILGDLADRGVPLVVGLEQMEANRQPELDRFNRREIDFEQLAKATD